MARSVFGIYMNREHAEEAVQAMKAAEFRAEDISVLMPENVGSKDVGYEKHTKAPEKAAMAGVAGGTLGGALGWLIGIGALAIPGAGALMAAGPIVAALAGVGAGSVLGGLTGALVGLGIPEYEAKRYEGRIRSGGALVAVHCETDGWARRAKDLLAHTGAEDISLTDEVRISKRQEVIER